GGLRRHAALPAASSSSWSAPVLDWSGGCGRFSEYIDPRKGSLEHGSTRFWAEDGPVRYHWRGPRRRGTASGTAIRWSIRTAPAGRSHPSRLGPRRRLHHERLQGVPLWKPNTQHHSDQRV